MARVLHEVGRVMHDTREHIMTISNAAAIPMAELSLDEMEATTGGGTMFCDMAGLAITVGLMPELGPMSPVAGLAMKNFCEVVTAPGFAGFGFGNNRGFMIF